jgi:hypothetical protein
MSKAWGVRPSELFNIASDFEAWCFDRAVFTFGTALDAELKQAVDGAKNQRQAETRHAQVMQEWLGIKRKFRDPAVQSKTVQL